MKHKPSTSIPKVMLLFRGGSHTRRTIGGHYFQNGKCDCGLTIEEYKKRMLARA